MAIQLLSTLQSSVEDHELDSSAVAPNGRAVQFRVRSPEGPPAISEEETGWPRHLHLPASGARWRRFSCRLQPICIGDGQIAGVCSVPRLRPAHRFGRWHTRLAGLGGGYELAIDLVDPAHQWGHGRGLRADGTDNSLCRTGPKLEKSSYCRTQRGPVGSSLSSRTCHSHCFLETLHE